MPVQVPGSAVSVSPTSSSPEIVGATVLAGGAGTTALGALVELSLPASFVGGHDDHDGVAAVVLADL